MPPAVLLRDAVALAGRYPVLAGVDLSVEPGEVVVLAGPNGAGKTSLLRACAGLLAVTGGEARVLGHDLRRNRSSVRRQVGMLGHAPAVYDELTAKENVRFSVRAGGGRVDGIDAALERAGLAGRLARTPAARLSAGQRRRIQLAVFVAHRVALWLLDEPHAGLDAEARALLAELVKEAAARGTSVLVASHELAVSAPGADRVVQMAGGRIVGELRISPEEATAVSRPSVGAARGDVHVA